MADFRKIINKDKAIIGMVHLQALPGTANSKKTTQQIVDIAVDEATKLVEYGFDAVLIENMHDTPYLLREVGPEIVAAMTVATRAVIDAVDVPVGLQILAGANKAAIAVATQPARTLLEQKDLLLHLLLTRALWMLQMRAHCYVNAAVLMRTK